MAKYTENFTNKLDWAMPFQRTGKFPLDRTDLFDSYADAVKYAAGNKEDPDSRNLCGTSYIGQIITVYENDTVTVYKINADRTLGSIGSATVVEGEENVIEKIYVNGEELPVDSTKAVNITVPVKLSDLTNDSNFIDNTVDNLSHYYTKDEIDTLVGDLSTLNVLKVDELPTEDISTTTIYLVPKQGSTEDVFDEYMYIDSSWERLGSTEIDLSNYLTKTGDGSNLSIDFTVAENRELPTASESIATIIGKLVKYITDLHDVAFTGSYKDLTDKPKYEVNYLTSSLPIGETVATITIPDGGTIVSTSIRDAAGIEVFTDIVYAGNTVEVSIAEALTEELSILVTYYK